MPLPAHAEGRGPHGQHETGGIVNMGHNEFTTQEEFANLVE